MDLEHSQEYITNKEKVDLYNILVDYVDRGDHGRWILELRSIANILNMDSDEFKELTGQELVSEEDLMELVEEAKEYTVIDSYWRQKDYEDAVYFRQNGAL